MIIAPQVVVPEGLEQMPISYAPTLEAAMQDLIISDTIVFSHELYIKDDCSALMEESSFNNIPGIGSLKLSILKTKKLCSCSTFCPRMGQVRYKQNSNCRECPCCACCEFEFPHVYAGPLYTLQNDKLLFQHFGKLSKLFVRGQLALEFHVSDFNYSDLIYGGCYSSHPHILFKNPNDIQNPSVYFEPQQNDCPTRPCAFFPGSLTCCSFCGMKQKEKQIKITFLSNNPLYNARCNIITRRTSKDACYSQCGCKSYCKIVDYPNTEIQFINVNQIDRLGIIMSAIHYSITDWWQEFNWYGKLGFNYPQYYKRETDF